MNEWIENYGWAIIIVVIVAAALYAVGVFDVPLQEEITTVERHQIVCEKFCYENNMTYQNSYDMYGNIQCFCEELYNCVDNICEYESHGFRITEKKETEMPPERYFDVCCETLSDTLWNGTYTCQCVGTCPVLEEDVPSAIINLDKSGDCIEDTIRTRERDMGDSE